VNAPRHLVEVFPPDVPLAVLPVVTFQLPQDGWWQIIGVSANIDASATLAAATVGLTVEQRAGSPSIQQFASAGVIAWDGSLFFGSDVDRFVPTVDTHPIIAPSPKTPFRGAGSVVRLSVFGAASLCGIGSPKLVLRRVDVPATD
jgi:hypothetical protein